MTGSAVSTTDDLPRIQYNKLEVPDDIPSVTEEMRQQRSILKLLLKKGTMLSRDQAVFFFLYSWTIRWFIIQESQVQMTETQLRLNKRGNQVRVTTKSIGSVSFRHGWMQEFTQTLFVTQLSIHPSEQLPFSGRMSPLGVEKAKKNALTPPANCLVASAESVFSSGTS